jgi:hypothetical protein
MYGGGGICCFAGHGCGVSPRNFGPQTVDAGRSELADGVSNMESRLELLLQKKYTDQNKTTILAKDRYTYTNR